MYLIGVLSGTAALLVSYLSSQEAAIAAAVAFAALLGGILFLERAPFEPQRPELKKAS